MDITNKAVKVSERMQEIEYRLACKDMTVRDADDLRYEYAELEDWNYLLNAYFKMRNEVETLRAENEVLRNDNSHSGLRTIIQRLEAENEALKIDVAAQLPTYKTLREAFMDGVYWYEQSNEVSQIALDKAAHEYANGKLESQAAKGE